VNPNGSGVLYGWSGPVSDHDYRSTFKVVKNRYVVGGVTIEFACGAARVTMPRNAAIGFLGLDGNRLLTKIISPGKHKIYDDDGAVIAHTASKGPRASFIVTSSTCDNVSTLCITEEAEAPTSRLYHVDPNSGGYYSYEGSEPVAVTYDGNSRVMAWPLPYDEYVYVDYCVVQYFEYPTAVVSYMNALAEIIQPFVKMGYLRTSEGCPFLMMRNSLLVEDCLSFEWSRSTTRFVVFAMSLNPKSRSEVIVEYLRCIMDKVPTVIDAMADKMRVLTRILVLYGGMVANAA